MILSLFFYKKENYQIKARFVFEFARSPRASKFESNTLTQHLSLQTFRAEDAHPILEFTKSLSRRRSPSTRVYKQFEPKTLTEHWSLQTVWAEDSHPALELTNVLSLFRLRTARSVNFWHPSMTRARDLTASSHDFEQFPWSIRLITADHRQIYLAARFPSVASAIHNFVISNPTETHQRLLKCGMLFTGTAWAIRRVSISDLLGIDKSRLSRLSNTMQWQPTKPSPELYRTYTELFRQIPATVAQSF
jgi:hypothetical protein